MERVYIYRECGIAYTILAIHTIFYSANKEITLEALVKEIRVMFDVYTKEDKFHCCSCTYHSAGDIL